MLSEDHLFSKRLVLNFVLAVLGYSVVDSNSSIWALGSMEVRALRFNPSFCQDQVQMWVNLKR